MASTVPPLAAGRPTLQRQKMFVGKCLSTQESWIRYPSDLIDNDQILHAFSGSGGASDAVVASFVAAALVFVAVVAAADAASVFMSSLYYCYSVKSGTNMDNPNACGSCFQLAAHDCVQWLIPAKIHWPRRGIHSIYITTRLWVTEQLSDFNPCHGAITVLHLTSIDHQSRLLLCLFLTFSL